jgi:hypothetical protein
MQSDCIVLTGAGFIVSIFLDFVGLLLGVVLVHCVNLKVVFLLLDPPGLPDSVVVHVETIQDWVLPPAPVL